MLPAHSLRRAELQARCEAQRATLVAHMADIEDRLQRTDLVLGTIRKVITRPAVMAGAVALLLVVRRAGWWPALSRGVVLLAGARRLYSILKRP
jgi:YqjK-like protein